MDKLVPYHSFYWFSISHKFLADGKMLFSIFGFKCLKLVWKIHRNSKTGEGPTCQHSRPPTCARPRRANRVTTCRTAPSRHCEQCLIVEPGLQGTNHSPRVVTPWRSHHVPLPARTPHRTRARTLALLPVLCLCHLGPPRARVERCRREHPTHLFSLFEQGLAASCAPPLGSQAVSAVVTLPLVWNFTMHCVILPP
jgi:hypothetical protein